MSRETQSLFASAISEHPVATQAVGELAGAVLDQLEGRRPDLLVAFISPHFGGAAEDIGGVLRAVLEPRALIGSTNYAVCGTGREVEGTAAISVWAASFASTAVQTVRLDVDEFSDGTELLGWPADVSPDAHTLVLLTEPFTFPVDGVLRALAVSHPDLRIIGGMASAANGPGVNRLLVDHEVTARGAVGVLLSGDDPVTSVVSQGCRPVGQPFTVTAVDGHYLRELGGRPAFERLEEIAASMSEEERDQLQRGLHIGLVVDEHLVEFGRGDFLIRNVMGARSDDGALAVGAPIEVGHTVQFQVRDAVAADADLRQLLVGHSARGALMFTCTGRGEHLFGVPHHDVGVVADLLGPIPLAGGFCAGEIGPVGAANHVHTFTASVALFS